MRDVALAYDGFATFLFEHVRLSGMKMGSDRTEGRTSSAAMVAV